MPKITITKEDILGGPLDVERHALLSVLDRLDLADPTKRTNMFGP